MRIDAAIQRRAATRYGVVTRDEIQRLGVSPDQIQRRVDAGTLVRVQPGVFVVAGSPDSFEQRVLGGCLAAGPGTAAAVSHRSAARLWGLRGAVSDRIEITVAGTSRPRLTRGAVHRSRLLEPVDIRVHDGIPVTRPERTLVDAAGVVPTASAISLLESSIHLGLTTPEHVWRYLSRYGGRGRAGAGRLRTILEARGSPARPTESGLEDLALRTLLRCGAPPPERQYELRLPGRPCVRIDLAYPSIGLAIEVDSALWHSDSESYRRDRAKWNLLSALGWTMFVLTDFDLHERAQLVALDIVGAHARLSGGRAA